MSETISRFVNTMTGGKVAPKKILEIREGKIKAALAAVEAQIGRLTTAGIRSLSLDGMYANLRAAHALALSRQDDAERYDALEKVKQKAREIAKLAEQQVNQILPRLTTLAQTSIAAWTAIKQAEAAIQQTPDATEKQRYELALADLQTRHTAHSTVHESTEISPFIAELGRVRAEAARLATDVTAANALALVRIAKLAEIDKELVNLRKLNQKVVDAPLVQLVTAKLTDLTTRRDAVAQAPLGQLQAELAKVPALLQDISNAAKESDNCGKWGEVKPVREMIRGACMHYITAANKQGKDKLRQDSLKLQQSSAHAEVLGSGDPVQALSEFRKITLEYESLKKEYYDEILRTPLLAKAEALEKNDSSSAEAQMKLALDSSTYEKRMLEAWNTAEVFGSPVTNKLSPGEALAIYTYTSNDYKKINGKLLKYRPPINATEEGQINIMIAQATNALAKLDDYVGITKRGDNPFPPDDDAQFVLNNVFTIKAFWSTGVGYSFPGKWQITIQGKTGKDVKPISNYPKEAEVLFPPGSKFKVIDRDDTDAPNTIYVTVEQVS